MLKDDEAPALPGLGMDDSTPHPTPIVDRFFKLYNEYAARNKWVVTEVLDEGRQRRIKKAIPVYKGLAGFEKNLEKAQRSDFLMGRVPGTNGRKTFKLHLDFLLAAETRNKLIDGLYNGEDQSTATKPTERIKPVGMNWRAILDSYPPNGRFWPAFQGNRPDGPGPYLAPAEMVELWRKKHGVTGMAGHNGPQTETREDRMASSIVSYRRHGQWDRANKIEGELAAIQKRPAVLVPAPDAPNPDLSPRQSPQSSRTRPAGVYANPRGPVSDVPADEPPPWSDADVPIGDYEIEGEELDA